MNAQVKPQPQYAEINWKHRFNREREFSTSLLNRLIKADHQLEMVKTDRNAWRVVSAFLALGYIAVWANTYIFGAV